MACCKQLRQLFSALAGQQLAVLHNAPTGIGYASVLSGHGLLLARGPASGRLYTM